MGEAFITRRGGDATIQHITATNAESLTLPLANAKRTKCMVFGVYTYTQTNYRETGGSLESSRSYRCALYGDAFDRKEVRWSYPLGGNASTTTEYEEAVTSGFFTRNDNSITLTIGYAAGNPTATIKYSNTIDIYVVDFD